MAICNPFSRYVTFQQGKLILYSTTDSGKWKNIQTNYQHNIFWTQTSLYADCGEKTLGTWLINDFLERWGIFLRRGDSSSVF